MSVGANVRSYASASLTPSTRYLYRVRAHNQSGSSAYSNTAEATTAAASAMHVGDIDGTRSVTRKNWSAKVTILVHDAAHKPVAGAVVSGGWSPGGSASCTTGTKGTCTVSATGLSPEAAQVTFAVGGVTKSGWTYSGTSDDPDGDSSGTAITIRR